MSGIPEGFDPSQMAGGFGGQMPDMGEMPEGFDPSQMQGGLGSMFTVESSDETETVPSDNTDSAGSSNRPSRDNMQMPGGSWGSGMNNTGNTAQNITNWIWIAASALILGAGLLIAKLYKR